MTRSVPQEWITHRRIWRVEEFLTKSPQRFPPVGFGQLGDNASYNPIPLGPREHIAWLAHQRLQLCLAQRAILHHPGVAQEFVKLSRIDDVFEHSVIDAAKCIEPAITVVSRAVVDG